MHKCANGGYHICIDKEANTETGRTLFRQPKRTLDVKLRKSGSVHRTRFEIVAPKREPTTQEPHAPMVDPDYLIIERDADKLHAYARGLLHQLRNPSQSYSFEMVKAATVWLVGAYVDARVPLAPEVYGLIAGVVKSNRRASSFRKVQEKNEDAYWAAIRFEATQPADPDGKAPSAATLYAVAKHVLKGVGFPQQGTRRSRNKDSEPDPNAAQKSAEATIRGWRKFHHYRQNVLFQRDAGAYFRQMRDSSRPME